MFATAVEEEFATPLVPALLPPPQPPPNIGNYRYAKTQIEVIYQMGEEDAGKGTRVDDHVVAAEPERWEAGWNDGHQDWSWNWSQWDELEQEERGRQAGGPGGSGARVELPELAFDHSPLTLGDWLALWHRR